MVDFQLYIDKKLVDLNENEKILFSKQRVDFENPTIIKNSFSKTVKIPGTKNNNNIFNEIWKLDRVQWSGSFNASKRTPFILLKNGSLYESGYVKLDSIIENNGYFSYNITLFGEIGNVLYKLSYKLNEDDSVSPLTLADLPLSFSQFTISKELIQNAWSVLKTGSGSEIFKTINFCVSYDGIPKLNNFDTKKMFVSTDRSVSDIYWRGVPYGELPTDITENNKRYLTVPTVPRTDPQDKYALVEMKNDITPLEARDLRSYLLRPVIKISKIFEGIDSYLYSNLGYHLNYSDSFFSTDEFLDTWMTLSALYEIDENVQSFQTFTKEQLLGNTDSPASYLISFCKIYGIYIDVDIATKSVILRRLPNFYTDNIKKLTIDYGKEVKITPLTFDKATYTFDYGDGDGEFLKKYKEMYDIDYGSARINTGYSFSADSAPYINNNVFRNAVDTLEQSAYYSYSQPEDDDFTPIPLFNLANEAKYKLFNTDGGTISSIEGVLSKSSVNTIYQLLDENWGGLQAGLFQDAFPKVQFHNEDNNSSDGKNVLVRFNGFKSIKYGYQTDNSFTANQSFDVEFLLTDDYSPLKQYAGYKNCYIDNPFPDQAVSGFSYISIVNELPSFTVGKYETGIDVNKYPLMLRNYLNQAVYASGNLTIYKYENRFNSYISSGSGRRYPYVSVDNIKPYHHYLLVAKVQANNPSVILSGNPYAYPIISGGSNIDRKELQNTTDTQIVMALVNSGPSTSATRTFSPLSVNDTSVVTSFYTYYMLIYDLTEFGLDDITSVDDAADFFGVGVGKNSGYKFKMTKTFNFGDTREIFIPYTDVEENSNVFDRYWKKFITDLYSIDSRKVECYCFLDNTPMTFRIFYYFDNSFWVLSSFSDWISMDKPCKATFLKVIDRNNYLS